METVVAIGLVIVAGALFWAVSKKRISGNTIEALANIAGIMSLIIALVAFVLPVLTSSSRERENFNPEMSATFTSTSLPATPTPTSLPTSTSTPLPATETPTPELSTIYSLPNAIHLGDQEFEGWPPLFGECKDLDFHLNSLLQVLYLEVEAYRTEVDVPVFLNDSEAATLPPQGIRFADHWIEQTISIPVNLLRIGHNRASICTRLVEDPDFPDDKDDFQLRNILLIGR